MNGPAAPDPVPAAVPATAHDSHEIWELLSALQLLRAHLWLGIVGEPSMGLCVLLAVDQSQGCMIIDALRQAENLVEGSTIYFDTQVEGRRLRFECKLARFVVYDNGPAYLATEPRLVLDQQRRSTYRVRVPIDLRFPAAIGDTAQMVPARLLDLSAQGCSTRVESTLHVDAGDPVRVNLKLSSLNLDCSGRVRNVQRIGGARRIGVEFEFDQSTDTSALDQAVARLQREILRRRIG